MQYSFSRSFYFLRFLFAVLTLIPQCRSKAKNDKGPKENPPVLVDVLIAQKETVNNIIEANGTVIASEFVELRPEISGRLTYLNIAEGREIARGTIVARVNDADLKAQVSRTKVQLDLAQKTVGRYQQLLDINGINQADYDIALNQVNTLKADINYTQALIDKTVVRAPFTGIAGLRQVSPGAFVTPSTIIATLQQTRQVKIDFTLPEMYSSIIKTGTIVDVELDANTRQRGRAMIMATEPGANTDTRNLKVRALLQGKATNPGAFVKIYVDAGKSNASVMVPTNCLIPDDKNNQVIVIDKGKAKFINVRTGVREAAMVEILEGVNVGDSVVVTGVLFARPNSVLKVRSVKTLKSLAVTQAGVAAE